MEHLRYDLGSLKRGSTVVVTLKNQANVQLMTRTDYGRLQGRTTLPIPRRTGHSIPIPHHRSVERTLGGRRRPGRPRGTHLGQRCGQATASGFLPERHVLHRTTSLPCRSPRRPLKSPR